jgi:HK97 family phage major capsid protein
MRGTRNTIQHAHPRTFAVIAKANNEVEILLFSQIGQSVFGDGIVAKQFKAEFNAINGVSRIVLRINSAGGDVFEAAAIYDTIKQSETPVDVIVDGICASAAFTIAMAGRRIDVGEAGMMMLHNARAIAAGEASEMHHTAEVLEKVSRQMAELYARRSGKPLAEVVAMMDAETWLTPEEAVEHGFADSVIGFDRNEEDPAAEMVAAVGVQQFANLPESLKMRVAALATLSTTPIQTAWAASPRRQEKNKMETMQDEVTRQREIRALGREYRSDVEQFLNNPEFSISDVKASLAEKMLASAKQHESAGFSPSPLIQFSEREQKAYSIRRAILSAVSGENCFEQEVSQHLQKAQGRSLSDRFSTLVPLVTRPAAAAHTLNVTTTNQGKETIQTNVGDLVDYLRARLVLVRAGATEMSGLSGVLSLPRQTAVAVATHKAESAAADQSDITFDNVSMSAKRATVFTQYTKDLLLQSSLDLEMLVRNDLGAGVAEIIEESGLAGGGVAPIPRGVLNTTGLGSTAYTATDATTKSKSLIAMETTVAVANGDNGNLAYIATPEARGMWKATPFLGNTAGTPIWTGTDDPLAGRVNGHRAFVSNLLPKTLGGGTNEHGCVFGNWASLLLGYWDGLEIIVDPYTRAKEAEYVVVARAYYDCAVRQPGAFCKLTGVVIA